jgi:hypothetical protein
LKLIPEKNRVVLMRRFAGVVSGIILAVACLCVPTVTILPYTLCENYLSANLSNRILVLALPEENNIIIENPKDVVDDYGGMNATPQSRIKKFYFPIFSETFKSYISGDSMVTAEKYRPDFIYKDLKKRQVVEKTGIDTGSLVFSIPEASEMQAAGLDSAVLVLIDRITLRRNNFYIEYYWDDKTKRPANLEANARVLIWDYKNDMPVFYGTITQKIEFQIAMQRKHWDESARSLAKKIVLSSKCL